MTYGDLFFFLQNAPASPPGGGLNLIFFMLLMFAGMWFLVIAPQRKKQKQHEAMVKALKSGDRVVTMGGVYGEVTNVKDDRLVVRIAENTKVEINRAFIHAKIDGE